MMCEIKDTFISSIFAQFIIVHMFDAWGMFAQAYAVMPQLLCRRISCICAIIVRNLLRFKYYRKLRCEIVYDDYYIII